MTKPSSPKDTTNEEIDKSLNRLSLGKKSWPQVTAAKRAVLLRECLTDIMTLSEEWIATACRAKNVERGSNDEGEEWLSAFMPVIRNMRQLIEALQANGQPTLPHTYQRPNGQWVAKVFPADLKEKAMLAGVTAEVWIAPGKEPTQGHIYQAQPAADAESKISLVLGAGNQTSIAPMDVLHKLFVENEVVILKLNPVNAYLGPYLARTFRALIEGNFFTLAYGDVEVGKYLCNHPMVESIHITGSDKTHDAIVWGVENQKQRKASGEPVNSRPITSELGCVSPIIVVPGPWSDAQINFQARQIAAMVIQNASFNCNAGKFLMLPKNWQHTQQLLDKIRQIFSNTPTREAYYPGANERYQRFLNQYPQAETPGGSAAKGHLPWTLLPQTEISADELCCSTEAFCGILGWGIVDCGEQPDPTAFLQQAVELANSELWGTLSCNLLIHPKTQKHHQKALDSAIERLSYGTIAINCWSGLSYGLTGPSWGAFPGHTLESIGSGIGTVHNTFMLDHPQKSVVTAPFSMNPTPAWFTDHRNRLKLGKALTDYEAKPSMLRLVRLAVHGLRG